MTSQNELAFGLAEIGQIAAPVDEAGRAIAFQRDALGMRLLCRALSGGLLRPNPDAQSQAFS